MSNTTAAEQTSALILESFDASGITVGNDTWSNTSGGTYVAWNWKANGAGVSNTNGTITSTVSANADAGFSIVSHTGTGSLSTVGHGLSQTPTLIITKKRSASSSWSVQHHEMMTSSTGKLLLESTAGVVASSTAYMFSATSSVFSPIYTNSGVTMIAYCFHSVEGYSKVGSYTGNGSADGTFVYTGFRPAYVMVKNTLAGGWTIMDMARDTYNDYEKVLQAQSSNAETTEANQLDSVSNGFKLRTDGTYSRFNNSGHTYIFLAIAETDFKHSNAR
jgi:hypothetical protein